MFALWHYLLFMLICAAAVVNYQALLTDRSEQLNFHIVYFIFPSFFAIEFSHYSLQLMYLVTKLVCVYYSRRNRHRRPEKLLFHKNYICKRSMCMILEQTTLTKCTYTNVVGTNIVEILRHAHNWPADLVVICLVVDAGIRQIAELTSAVLG